VTYPFEHDAVQLACDLGEGPNLSEGDDLREGASLSEGDDDDWVLRHIEG